ncbi:ninja-family protein AFP3-like [Curcuma longa]|uniref:ninja-family protein AFP3-like n=1 Tax=Curcuma longa TaxID=136217 RepID=UPI003D9ECC1C
MEKYPRDFLRRFVGNSFGDEPTEVTEGDSDEIELSLGLSLGGCFGAADSKREKLVRSSSIASFMTLPREAEFPAVPATSLTRTSSLPTETEEELRKRKQMQSLKRLEAKRKRLERKNSVRLGSAKPGENPDEDASGRKGSNPAAAEQMAANNSYLGLKARNLLVGARNAAPRHGRPTSAVAQPLTMVADAPGSFPPISQGSIGSQGSCGSSSTSDLEAPAPQGNHNKSINETVTNLQTAFAGKTQISPGRDDRARLVPASPSESGTKEMERKAKVKEKMPFVSTQGEGPNGRRVEGFLYKYGKGEEVRIVCVCHGSFLTPAEFVKHAGGVEVANPLQHIVVNSSPFAL